MSQHNITVEGGSAMRLKTAGKYCDRDIVVTATSGIDPDKILPTTVTGDGFVHLDDVSEVPHDITIQAAAGTQVKVYGRNLFDATQLIGGTGTTYCYYFVPIPNWRLTLFDKDTSVDVSGVDFGICKNPGNGGVKAYTWFVDDGTVLHKSDINISKLGRYGEKCDCIMIYPNTQEAVNKIKQRFSIMITAERDVPTEYEPYFVTEKITPVEVKSNSFYMNFIADASLSISYNKSWAKQKAYDDFWDNFQDKGNRTYYYMGCAGEGWNDSNFKPKYPFANLSQVPYMFIKSNITYCPPIDWSQITDMINQVFADCNYLRKIEKIIVSPKTTNIHDTTFNSAIYLTEIRIEGELCSSIRFGSAIGLSKASIESIINSLSNNTTALSVTLSKRAVNAAFETSEYISDGSTTAEWKNLVATKSNWTISLV